jgi:hypothetical protein
MTYTHSFLPWLKTGEVSVRDIPVLPRDLPLTCFQQELSGVMIQTIKIDKAYSLMVFMVLRSRRHLFPRQRS